MIRNKSALILVLLPLLGGCMQQPPPAPAPTPVGLQEFSVLSSPAGATVSFSTGEKCTTPCKVAKTGDQAFSVTVDLDNYKSQTVPVTTNLKALQDYNRRRGVNPEVINDIAVHSLRLTPNPVSVNLEPNWTK